MKIGELAKQVNIPVQTIRYWEKEGLFPPAERSEGNYRLYTNRHLERLQFIVNCRALDMSQEEIRRLLAIWDDPESECDDANHVIDEHIDHVNHRIESLQNLHQQLRALRASCPSGGPVEECGILQGLSKQPNTDTQAELTSHLKSLHNK